MLRYHRATSWELRNPSSARSTQSLLDVHPPSTDEQPLVGQTSGANICSEQAAITLEGRLSPNSPSNHAVTLLILLTSPSTADQTLNSATSSKKKKKKKREREKSTSTFFKRMTYTTSLLRPIQHTPNTPRVRRQSLAFRRQNPRNPACRIRYWSTIEVEGHLDRDGDRAALLAHATRYPLRFIVADGPAKSTPQQLMSSLLQQDGAFFLTSFFPKATGKFSSPQFQAQAQEF